MQQIITLSVLITGAVLASLMASLGMASAVHLTSRRSHGYMHWIFYAIVLIVAMTTLVSGRNLTTTELSFLEPATQARHPLLNWTQPLASLLMLTVAGERIISHWLRREKTGFASPTLLIAYITFWFGTVASPALLGAHPFVSHDYTYPLIIGIAAVLATGIERDLAFRAARDALLVFMVVGLLIIPLHPGLVLDRSYSQGLLPGVPRLAGLAAHAVSLGIMTQLGLLCLMAYPYQRVWLNRFAWFIGLTVLFLAQSKTAWIAFVVCSLCIIAVRKVPTLWRRMANPMRPEFGMLTIFMFMFAVLAIALVFMFGDVDGRISRFFNSSEGAQLASLTGRDKIWAIAYEEWLRNPMFGYGPLIWETDFRISIGMPNATHAHNQFMDSLSRSGSVGAVALLLYASVLLFLSVRYARQSKGLTLALFVALAMRSISEVPLSLLGYGTEFVTHLLLLMTLAAVASDVRLRKTQTAPVEKGATVFFNPRTAQNSLTTHRSNA